jgi:aldehyde:ferredoxin oxidoreductase
VYMPLLEVNLTTGSIEAIELPHEIRERWIGGMGLGVHLLSREIRQDLRVTDEECPIFILTGPLTGTSAPQSSDWCVVTLNAEYPKNICASHSHGYFGARLRHAGWDGVIVRGRAQNPVYLWINDGEPELRPAAELWGLDTFETQRRLLGELDRVGREVSVACIGPAGENLVEGGSVRNDWAYGPSQGGPGVAWGAKKLKAIAVCGTKPVRVEDPRALDAAAAQWREQLVLRKFDPSGLTAMAEGLADLGLIMGKNFDDPEIGVRWAASLKRDLAKWQVEALGSWNCETACHWRATCTTGAMAGIEFSGYGGEVMEELGPNLGIEDPSVAFVLCGMVDGYGMAAKSAPRTIAMLMQAFNAGVIGLEQTDGIDLAWGNHESVMKLLDLTVNREGIGELIAQGLRATREALGLEAFAVHMHGVGFNDHDQRATPMALFQSQVASGAGPTWQSLPLLHNFPEPDLGYPTVLPMDDFEHLAHATYVTQKAKLLYDSVGVCYFATVGVEGVMRFLTRCLEAAVGLRLTPDAALDSGERFAATQRLIAVYLGYRPEDDFDMADRLFEKIASGPAAGHGMTRSEFRRVRDEFYAHQGWSLETGAPSDETLERLGLSNFEVGAAPR